MGVTCTMPKEPGEDPLSRLKTRFVITCSTSPLHFFPICSQSGSFLLSPSSSTQETPMGRSLKRRGWSQANERPNPEWVYHQGLCLTGVLSTSSPLSSDPAIRLLQTMHHAGFLFFLAAKLDYISQNHLLSARSCDSSGGGL